MRADRLDDLMADGEDRIERRHRVLEDHGGDLPRTRRHHALGLAFEHVDAVEDPCCRQ
jgi:hypothetical protein